MAAVLPAAKEKTSQPPAGLLARLAEKPHPGLQPNETKLHWADQTAKLHIALGFSTSLYDFRVGPRCSAKERDSETGLDFFGARYMSSAQGRFTSPDPTFLNIFKVIDPQRWNLYSYTANNPLGFVDPDGEETIAINYPGYQDGIHNKGNNILDAQNSS